MREKKKRKMRPLREYRGKTQEFLYKSEWDKKNNIFVSVNNCTLYKEAFLNNNEVDPTLPSSITSLLRDYENAFPKETPHCLPPIL